jgi:hypothetical protein
MNSIYPTTAVTGGNSIYLYDNYKVHTYTTVGTSTITIHEPIQADVLIVAGGGGGGKAQVKLNRTGGGGGAGGLIHLTNLSLNAGTYTVTVGGGGAGATSARGGNGGNSVFGTYTAIGGGGGGAGSASSTTNATGLNGGSGGGAGGNSFNAQGGVGVVGQGRNGGSRPGNGNQANDGGAGGGFSGLSVGRTGGAGLISDITGTSVEYSRGGNASWCCAEVSFASQPVQFPNRGLGGTSSRFDFPAQGGGTGIVVLRYVISEPTISNIIRENVTALPAPIDNIQTVELSNLPEEVATSNQSITDINMKFLQTQQISREIIRLSTVSHVRVHKSVLPISVPTPYIRLINTAPIINKPSVQSFFISSLLNDESLYVLSDMSGQIINIHFDDSTLKFTRLENSYNVLFPDLTTMNYSLTNTFTYDKFLITLGSITITPNVAKTVKFVLPAFNTSVTMDISATVLKGVVDMSDVDVISIMDISLSDALSVFKFQTDASDIDPDSSGNDITYYIDSSVFPYLNVSNASTHYTDLSNISVIQPLWGEYDRTRSLLKHEYIRFLAYKLFNTHHAVDLFSNELQLKNHIYQQGIQIYNSILFELDNANLMTNENTTIHNIGRELMKQIKHFDIERIKCIEHTTLPQAIPLKNNDTLIFNVTINPAENQHLLTNTTIIPPRTYRIIFRITDTPNNVTPTD